MIRRRLPHGRKLASGRVLLARIARQAPSATKKRFVVRGQYKWDPSTLLDISKFASNCTLMWVKGSSLDARFVPTDPTRPVIQFGDTNGPQLTGVQIQAAANPGDKELRVASTFGSPGYYFVRDINKIESGSRRVGGELVRVTEVQAIGGSSDKKLILRDPLTQAYSNATGNLVTPLPGTVTVTENFQMIGLRIKGLNNLSYKGWLNAFWVSGLRLVDCKGFTSTEYGFGINYSRDITIQSCGGVNLPRINTNQVGWGYTIIANQSVNITMNSVIATNAQYTATLDLGCAKVVVNGLKYTQTLFNTGGGNQYGAQSSFDIHGGETYNVTVNGAISPLSDLTIGNTIWRRGSKLVTLNGCQFTMLRLIGFLQDFSANGCSGPRVKFEYLLPDTTTSNPLNAAFTNCAFVYSGEGTEGAPVSLPLDNTGAGYQVTNLGFTNCTITNSVGGACFVLAGSTKAASSVSFTNTTMSITTAATNNFIVVTTTSQLPAPPPPYSLSIVADGCIFLGPLAKKVAAGSAASTPPFTTKFFDNGVNRRGVNVGTLQDIVAADVDKMDF